jgi:hypothetical protein
MGIDGRIVAMANCAKEWWKHAVAGRNDDCDGDEKD